MDSSTQNSGPQNPLASSVSLRAQFFPKKAKSSKSSDKNIELSSTSVNQNSSDFGPEVDVSSSAGANPSALPSILADKFRTPVIDSILLQQYQDILKMVLVDEFRDRNELTLEHHKKALEAIGFREDWYQIACDLGSEREPDYLYGPGELFKDITTRHFEPGQFPKHYKAWLGGVLAFPTLRQFFQWTNDGQSLLYFWREREERAASASELFFDLVFVSFIFNLGLHYVNYPQFLLLYSCIWMIWFTVTQTSWTFVPLYLWNMFCVLAAVRCVNDVYDYDNVGYVDLGRWVLCAIGGDIVFYFFVAVCEVVLTPYPKLKRRPLTYQPAAMILLLLITWLFFALAVFLDVSIEVRSFLMMGGLLWNEFGQGAITALFHHTAPISIEHYAERLGLFVILHLGETMFSITEEYFVNFGMWEPYNYYKLYMIIFGGLVVAMSFLRVYFVVEAGQPKDPHALKRNHLTHYLFCLFHHVLCIAIITTSLGIKGLQSIELFTLDLNYELAKEIEEFENTTLYPDENISRALIDNATLTTQEEINTYLANNMDHYSALFCFGACFQVGTLLAFQWISNVKNKKYYIKLLQGRDFLAKIIMSLFRCFIIFVIGIIYLARYAFTPLGIVMWLAGWLAIWCIVEEIFTLNEEEHFLKNFEQLDNEREAAVEKLKASMLPSTGSERSSMSAGLMAATL